MNESDEKITYDDRQTQCSNLELELHYWGLAIDQIIFVEVSKIPWSGILGRGGSGRAPMSTVRIR